MDVLVSMSREEIFKREHMDVVVLMSCEKIFQRNIWVWQYQFLLKTSSRKNIWM